MRIAEEPLDPVLERAHNKALAFMHDKAIPSDKEDAERAEQIKTHFGVEDKGRQMARIFEAMVCDLSSSYTLPNDKYKMPQPGWFGYRGVAIKTSDYDDFLNHTDLVLEFDGGAKDPRRVQIAVDLTFGGHDETIQKKLATTQNEITSGGGRQLRYFESEKSGKKRNLHHLPSAVLGIGYPTISGLAKLWVSEDPKDEQKLRTSAVRKIIAQELLEQVGAHRVELEKELRAHPERSAELHDLLEQYTLAHHFAKDFFNRVADAKYKDGEDEDPVFRKLMAGRKTEARELEAAE